MNNQQRAAELLIPNPRWCETHHKGEVGDPPCGYCEADAEAGAERLADAGLLAPELPAPAATSANDTPVWRADGTLTVARYPDGEIGMLVGAGQEARYTPETARTQAALLLAAAKEETEAHRDH